MIRIRARDYTTEQLKDLVEGLSYSVVSIYNSPECEESEDCNPTCKAYAICRDLNNARGYLLKKIKERETLEIPRDTQQSE